jgi:hypothetical protein
LFGRVHCVRTTKQTAQKKMAANARAAYPLFNAKA